MDRDAKLILTDEIECVSNNTCLITSLYYNFLETALFREKTDSSFFQTLLLNKYD